MKPIDKMNYFPLAEKLANGKHRFFYKDGTLVDRLTN